MEKKWDIKIEYWKDLFKDLPVESADWKLEYERDQALDYVFQPLGMQIKKVGEKQYEVEWLPGYFMYFMLSESEGKKRLDRLQETYGTLEEWEKRKMDIREHILKTLGLEKADRQNPPPVVTVKKRAVVKRKYDGYTVENLALETAPGVYLCGSLYRPAQAEGKLPVMLCPHGHFQGSDPSPLEEGWGRFRPDMQIRCAMLAKMGMLAFSYDMVAWGESSLQVPYEHHRDALSLMLQTWNSLRAVDYFLSREDVDPQRIGVTGASGGGTQAFLLTALEPRISLSVPAVMVSTHYCGGCACESGLPIHLVEGGITNNAEIAAMCAPRPQLLISNGSDWTKNTPTVEFPFLKAKYLLYAAEENVEYAHFEEEQHDYGVSKRDAMYRFVAKHFSLDDSGVKKADGSYDESGVTVEPAETLRVFGALPDGAARGIEEVRERFLRTVRPE